MKAYPYTKIKPVFSRDTAGGKDFLEGVFRDPTVEFLKGLPWEATEKVDGMHVEIYYDGKKVNFYSEHEIPANLNTKLVHYFGGGVNAELFEQKFGEKEVIIYGEGYGSGITEDGHLYVHDNDYIIYDAYIPEQNLWLSRQELEDIAKTFGCNIVPIVLTGTLDECISFVKGQPASTIGEAAMEGVVCKPKLDVLNRDGGRVITKLKVVDHV